MAIKKFKVGTVVDKSTSKQDVVSYTIKTEDGKVYDDVHVGSKNNVYIHLAITKSFIKSKK